MAQNQAPQNNGPVVYQLTEEQLRAILASRPAPAMVNPLTMLIDLGIAGVKALGLGAVAVTGLVEGALIGAKNSVNNATTKK